MHPLAHPLVIVNPAAGRGRAAVIHRQIEAYWLEQGIRAGFIVPASRDDVRSQASAATRTGHSAVIVLGGDGTAHQAINGMAASDLPFAILPAGGGNDLARAIGMPSDPIDAAHSLLTGIARRIDLLRLTDANGRSCLYAGAGGAGIDADAAHLANTRFRRLPGMARYVAAAITAFRNAHPLEVTLTADGTARTFSVLLAAVANTPSYGGGIHITPQARIDDGFMDLALVAPLRWPQLLDGLLLALRNGDIRWPEIQRLRARKIRLETNRPVVFHGDGEPLGETPVEIEVLPGALKILAPA